jgi:hypothetical protein
MKLFSISLKDILFFTVAVSVVGSCKPQKRVIKSPPHYNFSEVQEVKLDLKLREISGLVWDPVRDEFLAHYDEAGKLFVLDKATNIVTNEYEFGPKGDYEDIALYKGVPYILRSDGKLFRIDRDSAGIKGVDAGKLAIGGTNDFETLYEDTARKALILLCKNCDEDGKAVVSAYAYYPDSVGFVNEPVYKIDATAVTSIITKKGLKKTSKLQPSAARIHPVLNKLYIISSAASIIVVANLNGEVEDVFEIGEKRFPQPEGLTFKSNGDMYISNEGVSSKATILRFVYKP